MDLFRMCFHPKLAVLWDVYSVLLHRAVLYRDLTVSEIIGQVVIFGALTKSKFILLSLWAQVSRYKTMIMCYKHYNYYMILRFVILVIVR